MINMSEETVLDNKELTVKVLEHEKRIAKLEKKREA